MKLLLIVVSVVGLALAMPTNNPEGGQDDIKAALENVIMDCIHLAEEAEKDGDKQSMAEVFGELAPICEVLLKELIQDENEKQEKGISTGTPPPKFRNGTDGKHGGEGDESERSMNFGQDNGDNSDDLPLGTPPPNDRMGKGEQNDGESGEHGPPFRTPPPKRRLGKRGKNGGKSGENETPSGTPPPQRRKGKGEKNDGESGESGLSFGTPPPKGRMGKGEKHDGKSGENETPFGTPPPKGGMGKGGKHGNNEDEHVGTPPPKGGMKGEGKPKPTGEPTHDSYENADQARNKLCKELAEAAEKRESGKSADAFDILVDAMQAVCEDE